MLGQALDWLYPPRCALCATIGEPPVCADCLASMVPRLGVAREVPLVDTAHVRFAYEGRAGQAVRRLKYARATTLAPVMSALLLEAVPGRPQDYGAVVPVPVHWLRQFGRGFNQSELLCRAWVGEYRPGALRRTRNTAPQVRLTAQERLENLRGAFAAQGVEGLSVLLVDDVVTTGGTATACAEALRAAGARSVDLVAFCGE